MEELKVSEQEQQQPQELQLTDVQKEAFIQAQKEVDDFEKELSTKKYLVDLSKDDTLVIKNFIEKDAQWKFMESLGIGEVLRELKSSADKNGNVFIPAVAVEAIYYYLSKVEGTGNTVNSPSIGSVEVYLRLLKAVNNARSSVAIDNEKKKHLEYILACRAEGLDPEDPEIKD